MEPLTLLPADAAAFQSRLEELLPRLVFSAAKPMAIDGRLEWRDPLTIRFNEPLDHGMLQRVIRVMRPGGGAAPPSLQTAVELPLRLEGDERDVAPRITRLPSELDRLLEPLVGDDYAPCRDGAQHALERPRPTRSTPSRNRRGSRKRSGSGDLRRV